MRWRFGGALQVTPSSMEESAGPQKTRGVSPIKRLDQVLRTANARYSNMGSLPAARCQPILTSPILRDVKRKRKGTFTKITDSLVSRSGRRPGLPGDRQPMRDRLDVAGVVHGLGDDRVLSRAAPRGGGFDVDLDFPLGEVGGQWPGRPAVDADAAHRAVVDARAPDEQPSGARPVDPGHDRERRPVVRRFERAGERLRRGPLAPRNTRASRCGRPRHSDKRAARSGAARARTRSGPRPGRRPGRTGRRA